MTIRSRGLLAAVFLALLPACASAQCSRPLQVPVAPIGQAITVSAGNKIGGIYPELLRAEAAKQGCSIEFDVVPRARQEMLYQVGQADLLVPARRSARRDAGGIFVPMIQSRAVLVSLGPQPPVVHSLSELLAHRELRVGVVRGYDYDQSYNLLIEKLSAQHRLVEATDPISLARMLDAKMADLAVLTPTVITGALRDDAKLSPLIERLHIETTDELPWGESGVYIASHSTLSPADRKRVQAMLDHIAKSGAAWRAFQHYYPDPNLSESLRPR